MSPGCVEDKFLFICRRSMLSKPFREGLPRCLGQRWREWGIDWAEAGWVHWISKLGSISFIGRSLCNKPRNSITATIRLTAIESTLFMPVRSMLEDETEYLPPCLDPMMSPVSHVWSSQDLYDFLRRTLVKTYRTKISRACCFRGQALSRKPSKTSKLWCGALDLMLPLWAGPKLAPEGPVAINVVLEMLMIALRSLQRGWKASILATSCDRTRPLSSFETQAQYNIYLTWQWLATKMENGRSITDIGGPWHSTGKP